jgi:hypothetical protein
MESWQKLLAAAAGATGVAALLYFLLQEDEEDANAEATEAQSGVSLAGSAPGGKSSGLGKEELIEILKEMVESQQGTTFRLKSVSKEMSEGEDLDFDKVYEMVKVADSVDPLQARGLTMNDLEEPLQRSQNDPQVMQAMQALMTGGQETMPAPGGAAKDISVEKITEINNFLLEELDNFMKRHAALPDKSKYAMKTVMIMVQATLDSKVMKKFGYEASDIQAATVASQHLLAKNEAFLQSHMSMQHKMESFMQVLQIVAPGM